MKKEMIYLRKNDDIEKLLDYAIKEEQFIYTNGLRGVGKTTALINYARKHNLGIFTYNFALAEEAKERYNYKYIYSSHHYRKAMSEKLRGFLLDDMAYSNLDKLIRYFNILTGYIDKEDYFASKEIYSDKKTVKELDINISDLINKINNARINNNYSDYKMLLNNLVKTIEAKNFILHPDNGSNNQYTINKIELPNVGDASDFIKELKDLNVKQGC